MKQIKIFESDKEIDLSVLIDSRMLLMANSGAGKSYLARKIFEESHGKVMSIIIDFEGEFKSLREKYDYLLIAKDGDVEINLKSAHLLPKKLLELNVPTIIDISDFKKHDRVTYVKKFLEALMELPREFWKPCLIFLDEIHNLAGQQEKQESTPAVIDLATRGRKRGFALIGATQRISKLHKDVCAELNNYCVGRTSLDIDMKRSADILGFSTKQDMLSLRELDDGEFYVFGPAISRKIEKEKVGKSKTTHPKQGMDIKQQIIPPTEKVKQIISKLNDLPKEQEKELKDLNDYKVKIRELEGELKKKPKEVIKEEKVIEVTDKVALEKAYEKGAKDIEKKYESILSSIKSNSLFIEKALRKLLSEGAKILESKSFSITADKPQIVIPEFSSSKRIVNKPREIPVRQVQKPSIEKIEDLPPTENGDKITGGAIRILRASASFYPNPITKSRAGAIAGLSYKSGTFGTYLSTLKRNNLVEINSNDIIITQEGLNFVGDVEPIPSDSESLINMWCNIVKGGASRMLKVLADNYPNSMTKEELGLQTDLSHFSGTFGTYLSTLKRNGLITVKGNEIKIAEEFFE